MPSQVARGLQLVADYQGMLYSLACLTGMDIDELDTSFFSWIGVRPLCWREGMQLCMALARSGELLPWENTE